VKLEMEMPEQREGGLTISRASDAVKVKFVRTATSNNNGEGVGQKKRKNANSRRRFFSYKRGNLLSIVCVCESVWLS